MNSIQALGNLAYSVCAHSNLQEALTTNNLHLFKQLLSEDVYLPLNEAGETILHLAIKSHRLEFVQEIVRFADLTKFPDVERYIQPQCYAIRYGNFEIFQALMEPGVLSQNDFLTEAVKAQKYDVLEWLLENVFEQLRSYSGAFLKACKMNDTKSAFLILERLKQCRNAEYNSILVASSGYTYGEKQTNALYYACYYNHYELAKAILETALHFDRLKYGEKENFGNAFWVSRLVTQPNDKDKNNLLELVIKKGYYEIFDLLLETDCISCFYKSHFINQETPLNLLCRDNQLQVFKQCLHMFRHSKKEPWLNAFRKDKDEPGFIAEVFNYAIKNNKLDFVIALVEQGFEINQSLYRENSYLANAILSKNIVIRDYLIDKGANFYDENFFPEENLLRAALNADDAPVIQQIFEKALKFKKLEEYDFLLTRFWMKEHFEALEVFLQSFFNYFKKSLNSQTIINRFRLWESRIPSSEVLNLLFFHAYKRYKTMPEWQKFFVNVESLVQVIEDNCLIYKKDLKKTICWFLEQIFCHILEGSNPYLVQNSFFFQNLVDILKTFSSQHLEKLLIALQTNQDVAAVASALYCHGLPIPSKQEFILLSKESKIQWLNYFQVFRVRKGLFICYNILKNQTSSEEVLLSLKAIEKIGVHHLNKEGQNKFEKAIRLNSISSIKHQAATALALWQMNKNPQDQNLYQIVLHVLSEADKALSLEGNQTELSQIIHLSGYLDYRSDQSILVILRKFTTHSNKDLRIASALALSKIPNQQGLLAALNVVRSPDWSHLDDHFNEHSELEKGGFDLFRSRPVTRHENRAAMIERILDQLVELNWCNKNFQKYLFLHSSQKLVEEYQAKYACMKTSFRWPALPIFFPKGTSLGRGIGTRKGEQAFYRSVVDLILKGSGSADLSFGDSKVDGGTWCKIGHIFSSHDIKECFLGNDSTYFTNDDAVLIIFEADSYNQAYLRGEARIENERTLNPVMYNGFSKKTIQSVYIHHKHKNDLQLLSNHDLHLEKAQTLLTSEIFKNLTFQELKQIRRQLMLFYPKIYFYDPENNPMSMNQLTQYNFCSRDEVFLESSKRLLARDLITAYLNLSNHLFLAQDRLLSDLNDQDFKKLKKQFFNMMCSEILSMDQVKNNHGRKMEEGKLVRVTLLEHTKEVIFGEYGGFGLKTNLRSDPSLQKKIRVFLRVAALFHDIGKLETHSKEHIKISLQKTREVLSKRFKFFGLVEEEISVVINLIKYKELLSNFLNPKKMMTLFEFEEKFKKACKKIKGWGISKDLFGQMLFCLQLADASTLSDVQRKRNLFLPLLDQAATLSFDNLTWLVKLKKDLHLAKL